jgi:hypothetical protein
VHAKNYYHTDPRSVTSKENENRPCKDEFLRFHNKSCIDKWRECNFSRINQVATSNFSNNTTIFLAILLVGITMQRGWLISANTWCEPITKDNICITHIWKKLWQEYISNCNQILSPIATRNWETHQQEAHQI